MEYRQFTVAIINQCHYLLLTHPRLTLTDNTSPSLPYKSHKLLQVSNFEFFVKIASSPHTCMVTGSLPFSATIAFTLTVKGVLGALE